MGKKFNMLDPKVRENALMETAMRIMDVYCDLSYTHRLNPYKVESLDYMELLQKFCEWAREYELEYYDTPEYMCNYQEHTSEIFTEKLMEEFGGEI